MKQIKELVANFGVAMLSILLIMLALVFGATGVVDLAFGHFMQAALPLALAAITTFAFAVLLKRSAAKSSIQQ